jgi:hypothetical protein
MRERYSYPLDNEGFEKNINKEIIDRFRVNYFN